MFLKNLKIFFIVCTSLALISLMYLWYENYKFKNSSLNENIKSQLLKKELQLKILAKQKFGVNKNIPLIISDKMPAKLFGMATINQQGKISIFLNKKRFKESSDYMINDVLPHEYAHALMFVFNDFSNENGGHNLRWEQICKKLDGLKCDRFVDNHDIVMEKTKKLYAW